MISEGGDMAGRLREESGRSFRISMTSYGSSEERGVEWWST